MDELSKRAQQLDDIIASGVSDRISLGDAQKIVHVWGGFLEHCSILSILFDMNIPKSLLPFSEDVLIGALNKMIIFHGKNRDVAKARVLTETMSLLVDYIDDDEALRKIAEKYNDPESRKRIVSSLKNCQENSIKEGFIIDRERFIR